MPAFHLHHANGNLPYTHRVQVLMVHFYKHHMPHWDLNAQLHAHIHHNNTFPF